MEYLNINNLKALHIEMSSKCNASCPMCARNISGPTINPKLPLAELSISDIKNFLQPKLLSQFEHIMFCGVYGDPIIAKDTLSAVKYFKESGVNQIWLHTNGSARSVAWWKELAQYFQDEEDSLVFNIDGLEDTNHLYRIGTSWGKIMENMSAFLDAGGQGMWCFLVFEHNEHQIEEAKKMALNMGIKKFRVRRTSRFPNKEGSFELLPRKVYRKLTNSESEDLHSEKITNEEDFIDYQIRPPKNPYYQNKDSAVKLKEIEEEYGSFDLYLDKAEINCIYQNKFKRLYLDFESKLWPCCFIPSDTYSFNKKNRYRTDFFEKVINVYGTNFNDIRKHSIEEILAHQWFKEKLTGSWLKSTKDLENPRLLKCARTCGHKYNPILSQTQNIHLKEN